MTEILQLIQWIGSLCGIIGFIILIFRFFKERPILKIRLVSSHKKDIDEENTFFMIDLDIDNIGDKPTTVKQVYVIITYYEAGERSYTIIPFKDFEVFHLSPRSSEVLREEAHLNKTINENILIEAHVGHTHGFEVIKSVSLFMFDLKSLISDKDDD